ncbi:hypothetical protein Tco_0085542 [Tanacetum coccineum]
MDKGCDAALETLPADMKAGEKAALMKKAYSTLELKKRTEGTKEEAGDGLYVKGRCFIWHSESHLKRDCPKKRSSGSSRKVCPRLRRSLISLGTLEKEGYTVKMQMGRIKVIKGCRVMMTGIKKKNRVYTLEAKVMTFGVQKHGGPKQVGLKQLGSKQVEFKQLGHKQVGFKQLGPGVEIGVHGVQVEKRVWFEVELVGAKGIIKLRVFRGNVAEKKKVNESMKANLGKLLKYTVWSTRWSLARGSSTRKRC